MLSREHLRKQIKLTALSTTSLRLLPFLGSKTDYDGRINFTFGEIEEANFMTSSLIQNALVQLIEEGWIYKGEDGFFYSNYNVVTTADNHSFYYIKLYRFFQSDKFKSMYKRRLNFLYYILSAKMPGTEHSVAIEHLYANRTNASKVKLPYFVSFEDMVTNLVQLIEDGFFEVRLGRSKEYIGKQTPNVKERIYRFSGKDGQRKHRLSNKEEKLKMIHIRIAKNLVSNDQVCDIYDITRLSTLQDLKSIAAEYGCSLDLYDKKSLEKVHMTKEKLYKKFGNLGIQIYRESLRDFFTYRSHAFQELMETGEFGNTIKNFYVIPRIMQQIKSVFKQIKQECMTRIHESSYLDENRTFEVLNKNKAYLSYFSEESYLDNLVILDHELNSTYGSLYTEVTKLDNNWSIFKQNVDIIYQKEEFMYKNDRTRVLSLAQQEMLTQKNRKKNHEKRNIGTTDKTQLLLEWLDEKIENRSYETEPDIECPDWMKDIIG